MHRRQFLTRAASGAVLLSSARILPALQHLPSLGVDRPESLEPNPDWASPDLGAVASASSHVDDPVFGYGPENALGTENHRGWQAKELAGAWLQVTFREPRKVSELQILVEPLEWDALGQDIYLMIYPRRKQLAPPRRLRVGFSSGRSYTVALVQHVDYFQIFALPQAERTTFVRFTIEEVEPKAGASETCLGKVRIFEKRHATGFEITPHAFYDVRDGKPVQSATLTITNPGEAVAESLLQVTRKGELPSQVSLAKTPARACFHQVVWIPAPFEDSAFNFELSSASAAFVARRKLKVPAYSSYFDGGTYDFLCTNHNDLGWLNTQKITADFRSSDLILPALELMKQYPEFVYTMEGSAYLMEFLERHPERREEMAQRMREKRFTWGASYDQLLELSAGPEKLVRQFYFGRGWIKKNFPGVDTHFYVQSDPPQMTLQMPQILARAGVKYAILGRIPWGVYNWQSPDGSYVVTRGFRYVNAVSLMDLKDSSGWLEAADERTPYYVEHEFPKMFVYDYTADYLPPQPDIVPYSRTQNERMAAFAKVWNAHYAASPARQIAPPPITFTTHEAFLDKFTAAAPNLTTLHGDYPFAWAYYDEPSNREALLLGRHAHNNLLAAERLYAGLGLTKGFAQYPADDFNVGWEADIWPEHGWGGNRGLITDKVYADRYARAKLVSDTILDKLATNFAVPAPLPASQIPITIYNCLSWSRTDRVTCKVTLPAGWPGWGLFDEHDAPIAVEWVADDVAADSAAPARSGSLTFLLKDVPAVGYRTVYLRTAATAPAAPQPMTGHTMENDFFLVQLGQGGIKSLYDKRLKWEVLRTDKFEGGEVLQFTANGYAWEDPETVGMPDFDQTSNHGFRVTTLTQSALGTTAVREAYFDSFGIRQTFRLYNELDRLDIDLEVLGWDGSKARELRMAIPVNVEEFRTSYEVPFGTVEMGKDEWRLGVLPSNADSIYFADVYGGTHALPFREAINWIDASSVNYAGTGCLAASDCTLHVFKDQTDKPVDYPVLQHVLLSTRKSLAWSPEYFYTQQGDHAYRASLMPHANDWRARYRDGIAFNYALIAFVGHGGEPAGASPARQSFLELHPTNLILTAMKKSEDDDRITVRFYEAEGNKSRARIKFPVSIRKAWKASLIEEDQVSIVPLADGSVEVEVGPWEIVTLKLEV